MGAWRVVGTSVRGASHRRRGLPNQDALRWWPDSGEGPPLAVAIADGHGSARCFRSDVGARLAVETALEVAAATLEGGGADRPPDLAGLEDLVEVLTRRWQAATQAHYLAHPFGPEEVQRLVVEGGAAAQESLAANPLLAYGATLSTVWLGQTFLLYFQLGDGEVLTVSQGGQVGRPLPGDARLFGGQTTSLCAPGAWRDFRIAFQTISAGTSPAVVLLSTDGYPNAFREDAGFLQVGADLLDLIRQEGLDPVAAGLESWLAEATEQGSGDDVTLGLLCHVGALPALLRPPAAAPAAASPPAAAGIAVGAL
ncbi:MAG TPA: PP2C family serine/threonine-protein phosphatase [Chloroflexota bacterium]|nr:PP2C family serine/threonine-protein phosphatase [Chloroflexota bacterium]